MKNIKIIFCVSLIFLMLSCKKDSNPVITEESKSKIPETTKILTESDVSQNLVSMSSDSTTFTFQSDTNKISKFKVNDVLVIPVDEGYLRKVTEIQTSGDQVIVHTDEAEMVEAIEEGEGDFSEELVEEGIQDIIYYVEGVEVERSGLNKTNKEQINININSVIYDADSNLSTKGDQIALNGSFTLTPKIGGKFHFSGSKVKKIEISFSIIEELNLSFDVGILSFTGEKEKKLTTIKFPTFTVPVGLPPFVLPVRITPEIDLFAGVSIDIISSIKTGIKQSLEHKITLKYEKGSWTNSKTNTEIFDFIPPTLSAGLKAKFYIKPKLKMKIYGKLSPYLDTELFGQFDANTNLTPWWKLYGGLNVGAGVQMKIFDKTILNYGSNFLQIHVEVAKATGTQPKVTTGSVTNVTANTATGGGNVTDQGSSTVTARGVCWSTSQSPTTSDNKTTNGTGTGSFTSSITGLSSSTTYYVRAYATNSVGTSYGSQVSFMTTTGAGTPPTVTTDAITKITSFSATGGGNVTSQGSSTVTARGVCWSTSQNPTTSNYKTSDGTGIGSFISEIDDLSPNTTFYVRAYATNSAGTSYGGQVSFTTISTGFNCGTSTVTYADKTYNTVLIGSQCWLKVNLNVGTRINGSSDQTNNSTIEKYCYNDQESNCNTYGGLYQWYEAMQYSTTAGARGICPPGWHIPTYAELQTLKSAVGDNGSSLKEVGQGSGGGAGTNTSGFSALLAGARYPNGNFADLGGWAFFWSSEMLNANDAYHLSLYSSGNLIYYYSNNKYYGFSVRCIKN